MWSGVPVISLLISERGQVRSSPHCAPELTLGLFQCGRCIVRFAYGVRLTVCRLMHAPHLGHASAALYLGGPWVGGGGDFLKTGSKKHRSGVSFSSGSFVYWI